MASKINYNNKAPFQTLEEIPDENKVNAADMNEIKQVVNTNADELNTAKEDIENLQGGQGTSNTEITSLKNRVSTLETDNSTNKTDINNLKTDNETNKSNIQTLQQDNETNKTDIVNLEENKVDKVKGKGLSTEDFTTVLKSKLEGLENYDDTEIKEDISNLEAEQTEQDKQIDMLINALPTETQENEYINLKGTIPVKFKEFNVSGNSKQETRSGKNLLPYPYNSIQNFVIQDLGDGRIILNGTQETNTSIMIKTFNLKAGTYKFLFNTAALPNNSYFFIRNQSTSEILKTNIKTNTTFSLEEDILTRLDLVLVAGSYSDYKLDLMILEATEEDESFEQYGAMPSPEYPSEIQNVEGDVNVTVANKNIANSNWAERFVEVVNDNSKARIEDVDGRRCLYFSANAGSGNDEAYFFKGIFKENTSYIIEYDIKPTTTNSNISCYYKDGTSHRNISNSGTRLMANAWNKSRNITATNKTIDYIRNDWFDGACYIDLDTVQIIEEGTTTSDYVKNEQQTVTFPLSEGQKLYKGDYLADDGIHHKRKQIELDGTEKWSRYPAANQFYITLNDSKAKNNEISIMSNYYKGIPFANRNLNSDKECAISEAGSLAVFTKDYTNVSDFKAYLAQKKEDGTPVTIEYELAEEEIEAYTPEQQEAYNQLKELQAYEEETNVYSKNEVSPIFKVTAVKDINSVITQLNTVLLERS